MASASAFDGAAGSPTAEGHDPEPVALTALPLAWLNQLLEDPGTRLPLFQACRFLRDLVLSSHAVRLHFQLPLQPSQAEALRMACMLSPGLELILAGTGMAPVDDGAAAGMVLSAMGEQGLTAAIKSVELQGLVLHGVVPPWLTTTCPNMTTLRLQSCRFSTLPDPTTTPIPICGQLTTLHLGFCERVTHEQSMPCWQHQLHALTGLQSLSIDAQRELVPPRYLACLEGFAPAGIHLTRLHYASLPLGPFPAAYPSWLPCVRELILTHRIIMDACLDVLLGMHTLQHLHCGRVMLQRSLAHRPCSLALLSCEIIDVAACARLPLGPNGVQSLQANPGPRFAVSVCPVNDLETTNRAVAAIHRCGGLQWEGAGEVRLIAHAPDAACLAATLPILSGCTARTLMISNASPVTAELLAAMGQHLASCKVAAIEFHGSTLTPGLEWPSRLALGSPFALSDVPAQPATPPCTASDLPLVSYIHMPE